MPSLPEPIPFDLSGLSELASKANPELAKEIAAETGAPVEPVTPPAEETPAEETPASEQTPPADEKPAEEIPAEEQTPPAEETPLDEELQKISKQRDEEAAKKSADEKAAAAAKVTTPKEEKAAPSERDKDIHLDDTTSRSMRPSTRKLIEERNQKITSERNRAEQLAKEKAELETKLAEISEAAKKVTLPKEIEEELKTLRERVRELDITRDPEIQRKYDAPVRQNEAAILAKLGEFGLGKTNDGKDDPEAIDRLKRAGLTINALAPHIKKLEEAGEIEAAETLRELTRENRRLAIEKAGEVAKWKADFDGKVQLRNQQVQQQQEQTTKAVGEHANRILNENLTNLAKTFPFVLRPAAPLPTDSAAVAKAKNDAIAAYDAAQKTITETLGQLDSSKVSPDKAAEVQGRASATLVQGVILRDHVLPRIAKENAELRAKVADLEAKAGKLKAAGTLSRAHAAAATAPSAAKAPLPESTEDAAKQIAREMGISVE